MPNKKTQRAEFIPARLRQSREAKAWTMSKLADEVQLTRQAISQFEKGESKPSPEKLRELAKVLEQPEHFFTWPLTNTESRKQSPPTFRSMASSTARARDQAEALLEWLAAMVAVLSEKVQLPTVYLPVFSIDDFTRLSDDDVEQFAVLTRKHFGLGNGPISNLTLLLENSGVVIAFKKLNHELSGLSQWFDGRPFVLIDPSSSAARTRFSLAHELGHIVLHRQLASASELLDKELLKLIEHQANYFGSAFMLPEESLAVEVYGVDWQSLVTLKARWRMAISALVMRLHAVDLINENQKTRIFREISVRNARKREPLDSDIPHDYPRLLRKVVDLLDAESVLESSSIPNVIRLNVKLISELGQILPESLLPKGLPDNVISIRR
jgi:Zn-dependent peptidase ImmA (M78 family)/transcriptional regulator with XRE-family HTH domain